MDSVPTLTISGQVFLEQTIKDTNLRQLGIQEINIVDLVKPITKYAPLSSSGSNSFFAKLYSNPDPAIIRIINAIIIFFLSNQNFRVS